MNQDQIKEKLLLLNDETPDFSVIMTGKKSNKVNGLYKPLGKEILLHNKNFDNDNSMMYTAIHEFAHHVHFTSSLVPISSKAHTIEFWSIFHTLLMDAEQKEIYENVFKTIPEFIELTKDIKENYLAKNGQIMKDLGKALITAHNLCQKYSVRLEDYYDRELLINRNTASNVIKFNTLQVNPEIGFDNMKIVAGIKNDDERKNVEAVLTGGEQSIDMIKQRLKKKKEPEVKKEFIKAEIERIDKTIARLLSKKEEMQKSLEEIKDDE